MLLIVQSGVRLKVKKNKNPKNIYCLLKMQANNLYFQQQIVFSGMLFTKFFSGGVLLKRLSKYKNIIMNKLVC